MTIGAGALNGIPEVDGDVNVYPDDPLAAREQMREATTRLRAELSSLFVDTPTQAPDDVSLASRGRLPSPDVL